MEVSPVLRGSVHPAQEEELSANAEKEFGYAKMQLLSFEDLYAGKLCAALDRQHPRDLFDIHYKREKMHCISLKMFYPENNMSSCK